LHCISCRRLLWPITESLDIHLELGRENSVDGDAKPLLPYAVAFDASADSLDALLEQTHQRAFALRQGFFSGKCLEQKQLAKQVCCRLCLVCSLCNPLKEGKAGVVPQKRPYPAFH
jgi:hypothetical protein